MQIVTKQSYIAHTLPKKHDL